MDAKVQELDGHTKIVKEAVANLEITASPCSNCGFVPNNHNGHSVRPIDRLTVWIGLVAGMAVYNLPHGDTKDFLAGAIWSGLSLLLHWFVNKIVKIIFHRS